MIPETATKCVSASCCGSRIGAHSSWDPAGSGRGGFSGEHTVDAQVNPVSKLLLGGDTPGAGGFVCVVYTTGFCAFAEPRRQRIIIASVVDKPARYLLLLHPIVKLLILC